jgi:hypothetical protein
MLAHARNAVVLLLVSGAVWAAPVPFLKKPGPRYRTPQQGLTQALRDLTRYGKADIPELGLKLTAQTAVGNKLTNVVLMWHDGRGKARLTDWAEEVEVICAEPTLFFVMGEGKSSSDDGSTAEWSRKAVGLAWPDPPK